MAYFKKYCGCLLDYDGRIVVGCNNPLHKIGYKVIYTPNGIDTKKIKLHELTGEDISRIMFAKMTAKLGG